VPDRLCPKCGAYWECGCVLEEWRQPEDESCHHDWVPAVGVEFDQPLPDDVNVIVCRLCGLYAVGAVKR
jgi:hypothetical protein